MKGLRRLVLAWLVLAVAAPATAQVVLPNGAVIPDDAVRRAPSACEKGDSLACLVTGFAALEGRAQMVDVDAAAAAFRKACDLGSGIGCEREAFIASFRHDKAQDLPLAEARRKQAAAMLGKTCDEGTPLACHWLGTMLEGQSALQDQPRAVSLYAKACFDHGFGAACRNGYQLTNISVSAVRDKAAAGRFEAVAETAMDAECQAGKAGACNVLAAWVRQQRGEAEAFYIAELGEKACDGGVAEGCMTAGDLANRLDESAAGWDKMYSLFERACWMRQADCTGVANILRKAPAGKEADRSTIFLFDMRACTGGVEESCWLMFEYGNQIRPSDVEPFIMAFDHACLKLLRPSAEICATAAKNHAERAGAIPAGAAADRAKAHRLYTRALELPEEEEYEPYAHAQAREYLMAAR